MARAGHLELGAAALDVVLVPVALVHSDRCAAHRDAAHWVRDVDRSAPAAGVDRDVGRQDQVVDRPERGRSHQEVVRRDPAVDLADPEGGGQDPGQAENFAECGRHAGHRRWKAHGASSLTGSPKLVSVWVAGTSGPAMATHVIRRAVDRAIHSAAERRFVLVPERRRFGKLPST